jgi:hypothetical protein
MVRMNLPNARHPSNGGWISVPALLFLATLLVLPALALYRSGINLVLPGA